MLTPGIRPAYWFWSAINQPGVPGLLKGTVEQRLPGSEASWSVTPNRIIWESVGSLKLGMSQEPKLWYQVDAKFLKTWQFESCFQTTVSSRLLKPLWKLSGRCQNVTVIQLKPDLFWVLDKLTSLRRNIFTWHLSAPWCGPQEVTSPSAQRGAAF